MADRLSQHLERRFTLQNSDGNSQNQGQGGKAIRHEADKHEQSIQESCCLDDGVLDGGGQTPSVICFIKLVGLLAVILCLVFTLPLCLIVHFSSNSADLPFLSSLSIFSSISEHTLQSLAYLSIPVFFFHLVLLILLSFKLKDIQTRIDRAKKIPNSYALLLRIPPSQLREEQLCHEIDAWFRKEFKFNNRFPQIFPELCPSQEQEQLSEMDSSVESQEGKAKKLQSRIVEAIFLSFNYEQYAKISQEVSAVDQYMKEGNEELKPAEINALIQFYNRKKNILAHLPLNQYCLVLFKNPRYCQYFYQRTQGSVLGNFFCVEKYSDFEIEGQRVEAIKGLLPNQIYWKSLHYTGQSLITKRLAFLALWILLVSTGIGLQFLCIYMRVGSPVSALLINILVFLSNKLLVRFHQQQPYAYYSQQKKAIIAYLCILNLVDFTFSPLVISYLISPALLSDSSQFIFSQVLTLLFFMAISVANTLFTTLCCKEGNEVETDRFSKQVQCIESLLSSSLTVISMTYLLAPMFPIVVTIAFIWFVTMYILQRSIVNQGEYRGGKLLYSMLKYLHRSIFCFMCGLIVVYSFTAMQLNTPSPLSAILIVSLLCLFAFILQFIGFGCLQSLHGCLLGSRESELKGRLLDDSYVSFKHTFLMLYEKFNFALSETPKNPAPDYGTRMKIYEQLNTMSKTLSLSLKERLFANINPIINNDRRVQQPELDVNDIYFQYERKVTMNKITPKIAIPPLFRKEDSIEPVPQDSNRVEMVNFNSIFSSDDKDARKLLRNHIKRKLQDNAVHK